MLTLYTTAGCHLCEEAAAMLQAAGAAFSPVDIAEDPALLKVYGIRIPVLRNTSGQELGWPFDGGQLADFLNEG